MMADDDTLTLNLSVPNIDSVKSKKQVDSSGKRKKEDDSPPGAENIGAKKRKKKHPKEDAAAANDSVGKDGKDFISSLFNHNPDIPRLDLTNVTPLHEKVFTARSFSDVGVHPYLVQNLEQNLSVKEMTQVHMTCAQEIKALNG